VIFVANAEVVDDATTSAATHNGIRMHFPQGFRGEPGAVAAS